MASIEITPALRLVALRHPDDSYAAWQLERTWQGARQWRPITTNENLRPVLLAMFAWLMEQDDVKTNLRTIEEAVETLQRELE